MVFPIALAIGTLTIPNWNRLNLWPLLVAAVLIPLLVILRHRQNIQRLLTGTESKIRQKHPTA